MGPSALNVVLSKSVLEIFHSSYLWNSLPEMRSRKMVIGTVAYVAVRGGTVSTYVYRTKRGCAKAKAKRAGTCSDTLVGDEAPIRRAVGWETELSMVDPEAASKLFPQD